ncbi:MAG TPA: hypothetical protein VGL07_16735 [Buttiauxella sp.]|jgi:hypothetical protein
MATTPAVLHLKETSMLAVLLSGIQPETALYFAEQGRYEVDDLTTEPNTPSLDDPAYPAFITEHLLRLLPGEVAEATDDQLRLHNEIMLLVAVHSGWWAN